MKVLEMYSDTWLPERLISDRWDSSLFSILLNCGATGAETPYIPEEGNCISLQIRIQFNTKIKYYNKNTKQIRIRFRKTTKKNVIYSLDIYWIS